VGGLARVSAAADGKSCAYKLDDADVTLSLVPVTGGADATLAKIEADLKGEMGAASGAASPAVEPPKPGAKSEADRVEADAWSDAKAVTRDKSDDGADLADTVKTRTDAKPGGHGASADMDDDKNDEAHVNLPFIHIDAQGDKADVHVGPIHVDANGETATVKMSKAVRLRGEPFSARGRGIRATFVYAGDDLGSGYKYIGYEASGPQTGPLAVAVVRSRASHHVGGDLYDDVKRLVRRNGGA
jgi:hypothetical protein